MSKSLSIVLDYWHRLPYIVLIIPFKCYYCSPLGHKVVIIVGASNF